MTRILIVDDHVLFREGLVGILETASEFEVIGEAGSASEAIEQARLHKPDMILMDWGLPDADGISATKQILSEQPECKIIFLTIFDDDEILFSAIRGGAKGFLLKNVSSKKLLEQLSAVNQGQSALSKAMTARLIEEFSHSAPGVKRNTSDFDKLSPREVDVLREIINGASNCEIASNLFITENTVKHHIHNILEKLGVQNRHQAANYARQNGFM
jgi:DNA-binding NarL/FixJ family response regulator